MSDAFYNVDQIAKLIHMHPKTIRKFIREGELIAHKIGNRWRVYGHDLSLFVESQRIMDVPKTVPNETQVQLDNDSTLERNVNARVSTVVDIDSDIDKGIIIVNSLTAAMNAENLQYGNKSLYTQYMEEDHKIRIMLTGSIEFIQIMLSSIKSLMTNK